MADVEIEYNAVCRTRDGVDLRSDIFRPASGGPWPVLLHRTPYGKRGLGLAVLDTLTAVQRGYLVVHQDVRGRVESGGEWEPMANEGADGYDAVRWAAGLPGSTGEVGMFGGSYNGHTQWAAALAAPPELKTIAPVVTWSDARDGMFSRGGALELGLTAAWSIGNGIDTVVREAPDPAAGARRAQALIEEYDGLAEGGYWQLPSGDLPAIARHPIRDSGAQRSLADPAVADRCTVAGRHDRVQIPVLNVGGWYDLFCQGTIDNFVAMHDRGVPTKLVMAPWTHGSVVALTSGGQVGDINFGFASSALLLGPYGGLTELQLRWFDHWLKGRDTGLMDEPPVQVFVMGANVWRAETSWPPAATARDLYLRAGGLLSGEAADEEEPRSCYVYDPKDPVVTTGGCVAMSPDFAGGPLDQAAVEAREDVLLFTGEPLERDITVAGRVTAVLYVATDAPSTDWVVRLCDVDERGTSRNIADGIARHRHAAGAAEVHVDLWSTCQVFRRGHRIRVQVTSSNFPKWDRNPNTGDGPATARTLQPACQAVLHGPAQPSRLVLPVVTGP